MYRPPPLRGRPVLEGKKVLLIDRNQPTRAARAGVLRDHGIEVHAEDISGARFLWQPNVYDLILLDVRKHPPGEARELFEQIRDASPGQRFAFLVGPPIYLSLTWPEDVMATHNETQQWAETVKRALRQQLFGCARQTNSTVGRAQAVLDCFAQVVGWMEEASHRG